MNPTDAALRGQDDEVLHVDAQLVARVAGQPFRGPDLAAGSARRAVGDFDWSASHSRACARRDPDPGLRQRGRDDAGERTVLARSSRLVACQQSGRWPSNPLTPYTAQAPVGDPARRHSRRDGGQGSATIFRVAWPAASRPPVPPPQLTGSNPPHRSSGIRATPLPRLRHLQLVNLVSTPGRPRPSGSASRTSRSASDTPPMRPRVARRAAGRGRCAAGGGGGHAIHDGRTVAPAASQTRKVPVPPMGATRDQPERGPIGQPLTMGHAVPRGAAGASEVHAVQ